MQTFEQQFAIWWTVILSIGSLIGVAYVLFVFLGIHIIIKPKQKTTMQDKTEYKKRVVKVIGQDTLDKLSLEQLIKFYKGE